MRAMLIWDGGNTVNVPPSMGTPCPDQLTGTVGEQLIETACRLCYDSMGLGPDGKRKGRATEFTLAIILEHKHHSVLEHYTRTAAFQLPASTHRTCLLLQALLNRRGVWSRFAGDTLRVTMNARAMVEWDMWSERLRMEHGSVRNGELTAVMSVLGDKLQALYHEELPLLVAPVGESAFSTNWASRMEVERVEPETDHEKHITLYLRGSRGFSHEQVRHRFGISQRSTRFADEDESPWDLHPLIEAFCHPETGAYNGPATEENLHMFINRSREVYKGLVKGLQEWLLSKLIDERTPEGSGDAYKPTKDEKRMCRKQARGAARGMLGNALRTDMAFTASVADWRHVMIPQRGANAADAEIRRVFMGAEGSEDDSVLGALRTSRYADAFTDVERVPSKDGTSLALA